MRDMQLTIDGGAVSIARSRRARKLTAVQRDVMVHARGFGTIRSVEAGKIAHAHRGHCGFGAKSFRGVAGPTRAGCCGYAAIDGRAVLKRLVARDLLAPTEKLGTYTPVSG